jgi:acetylornithine deacetylase/succinyl-diaminopimelate desuccinylase-like protein
MTAPATAPALDPQALREFTDRTWDDEIVPALTEYIAIPAKSPMFDADWQRHGFIDRVVRDAAAWVEGKKLAGLKLEVIRLEGRTPVIFFELPATKPGDDTVVLYGHLQTARVQRLAQRPRAVDAEVRERPAVRPRRGR